jgi:hypothetical protein
MAQRADTRRKRARSVAGGAPSPGPLRLPPQLDGILRLHRFRDLHWYFVIERELREELEASKKVAVAEPESLLHNKEWILQGMTEGAVFGLSMTETDSLVYHAGARTDESFMGDNGRDRRAFILPVFCLVRGDRVMLMWTAGRMRRMGLASVLVRKMIERGVTGADSIVDSALDFWKRLGEIESNNVHFFGCAKSVSEPSLFASGLQVTAQLTCGPEEGTFPGSFVMPLAESPLSTEEHLVYEAGSGLCTFTVRNACIDGHVKMRTFILPAPPNADWIPEEDGHETFFLGRNEVHTLVPVELLEAADNFCVAIRLKVGGIWKTYKTIECRFNHALDDEISRFIAKVA